MFSMDYDQRLGSSHRQGQDFRLSAAELLDTPHSTMDSLQGSDAAAAKSNAIAMQIPAVEDKQQRQQLLPDETAAMTGSDGVSSNSSGKILQSIFYVPKAPELTRVPPPSADVRKPPQPGYDMRTLRRQLEFLNRELQGSDQRQHLLYRQNEQLWHYVQELLQANKSNAQLMRSEVGRLQSELRSVYKERQQLAEQLIFARNSKDMLQQLSADLQERAPALEELRRRKLEAEEQLMAVQEENQELEGTLRQQLQRMRSAHDELEALRQQKVEEAAMDAADEFFHTNRAVLRSAYHRFKVGVQQRYRMERISDSIRRMYYSYLQRQMWELWRYYCCKRDFMRSCLMNRRRELLMRSVERWRLYTALERLFRRARRHMLLRRNFHAWRELVNTNRFESWAQLVTVDLQQLQLQRRVFRRWASVTVFTGWYDSRIEQLVPVAAHHFQRRLLFHWHRVAAESKNQLEMIIVEAPLVIQGAHFRCWHRLCGNLWRRRGRLLRRFFRELRLRVREREERAVTRRFVLMATVEWKLRNAIVRWQNFAVLRSRGPLAVIHITKGARSDRTMVRKRQLVFEERLRKQRERWQRLARGCFLLWEYRASVQRRQRVLDRAATRHYVVLHLLKRHLHLWHHHVLIDIRTVQRKQRRLKRRVFVAWATQTQQFKKERSALLRQNNFRELQQRRRLVLLLHRWQNRTQKRSRLRRAFSFRRQSAAFSQLWRLFRNWRGLWGHQQYWRCKELQLEAQRMQTIVALNEQSLEDLEVERTQLEHQRRNMEESALQMQEKLSELGSIMQSQEVQLQRKESEKQNCIDELQRLKKEFEQLQQDRNRLKGFEQQLQYERSEREQETLQLQAAAQEVMANVQRENEQLQQEVQSAREQAVLAERFAEVQIAHQLQELEAAQQEAAKLQDLLAERKRELQSRENEQIGLRGDLDRVQQKLKQVRSDGELLIHEQDSAIRARSSELRVLRSNSGLSEARVETLRELVREEREALNKLQLEDVLASDGREIKELRSIRDDFIRSHSPMRSSPAVQKGLASSMSALTLDPALISSNGNTPHGQLQRSVNQPLRFSPSAPTVDNATIPQLPAANSIYSSAARDAAPLKGVAEPPTAWGSVDDLKRTAPVEALDTTGDRQGSLGSYYYYSENTLQTGAQTVDDEESCSEEEGEFSQVHSVHAPEDITITASAALTRDQIGEDDADEPSDSKNYYDTAAIAVANLNRSTVIASSDGAVEASVDHLSLGSGAATEE